MKQKMLTVLLVLIAHLLVFQSAQAYPDRPIKLVVPSPAVGPPDQIARLISDKMAAALGQPVIVENRTGGAGGIIGAKRAYNDSYGLSEVTSPDARGAVFIKWSDDWLIHATTLR